MKTITSFTVDHDFITPGIYISRIDGDITTYDLRTRTPNTGDLMDYSTMHTAEHMFATFIRNSEIADNIIYFGPMGCQTGFYLLVRGLEPEKVLAEVITALKSIIAYEGPVFGASRKECGNYKSLNLESAKLEFSRYLKVLENKKADFKYAEQ